VPLYVIKGLTSSLKTTHSGFLPQSTLEGWMNTAWPVAMTR
jgi:hypothetical protein